MQTYNVDAFALRWVLWFDDPHVVLLFWAKAVEVGVEVCELIWKNVRVWNYVEIILSKFFLHLNDIFAKTVFPGQFAWVRKVVYFLVLIQIVIYVLLLWLTRPEHVPVVALGLTKSIRFEHRFHKLCVSLHHLEEQLKLVLLVLTWFWVAENTHSVSIQLHWSQKC